MKDRDTLDNLLTLLKISSKSSEFDGLNILGKFIQTELQNLPLRWHTIKKKSSANFLYAKSIINDPSKPMILLSSHIDTVYSFHETKFKETDNKVYGSGAQDMKASVSVIMEVLSELGKNNQLKNIIVYFCPEEETATLNYREEVDLLAKQADYALVFESTLDREPDANMNKRSIVTSRRGFKQFNLKIEDGPGGHSGVLINKNERHSAILLAAEIVLRLESFADYNKETTLNIGSLNGGGAINIIAPSANIFFETRFRTQNEYVRIEKEVIKLVDHYNQTTPFKLSVDETGFYPPFESNGKEESFIKKCFEAAEFNNLNLIEEFRGGGSEASLIKYSNPECAVLDGFGVRGAGQHTTKEFVYKESIFSTIDYVYSVIKLLQT